MSSSNSLTVVFTDPYMYDTIKTLSNKLYAGNDSLCLRELIAMALGDKQNWEDDYGPIQRIKSAESEKARM